MTTIELRHETTRDAAEGYDGLAIEVRGLTQDVSRRRRGGQGDRLRRRTRRGLRPARPERRRQVDDDRDAHDDARSRRAARARLAGLDVARDPLAARQIVERRLPGSGRRPLAHGAAQSRASRAALGRQGRPCRRADRRDRRGVRHHGASSTAPSRATAVGSGGAWRSRARSSPTRRSCSSTSRRSGSTRGSATSCST